MRRLVILDDLFPHLGTAFRIAEYNAYLEHFESAAVYSTASAFPYIGETRSFSTVLAEYESHYPQYKNRVFRFASWRNFESTLTYTVFINNAFRFIDVAERHRVPLVYTLYPGGGFSLNDPEADARLRRVCSSPSFRAVIVTQRISYEYLVNRELCDPRRIEFIYGGFGPVDHLTTTNVTKKYYQRDKDTFDICFVAFKYTARGVDKGYDVFVEVAKALSRAHSDIFFHVVGNYDETDIDVSDIRDRMTFYGTRYTEWFPGFYSGMDIIVSPNLPFVLTPGSFDGFPTTSVCEAALCGVAALCTDVLNLNVAFQDRKELVIIPRDIDGICEIVDDYYNNLDELYELAGKGQQAIEKVASYESQIRPRLRLLSKHAMER